MKVYDKNMRERMDKINWKKSWDATHTKMAVCRDNLILPMQRGSSDEIGICVSPFVVL